MAEKIRVTFQPMGISCHVPAGRTIMEASRKLGIPLRSECGGQGTCGQCLVEVTPLDHVSPLTENESSMLSPSCIAKGGRLACETNIMGPVSISVSEAVLDGREALGKTLYGTIQRQDSRQGRTSASSSAGARGIAIDIGTTTLGLYLCDLQSGEILHSAAGANPQRRYGEDVISRIAYTNDHPHGLEDLHHTLIGAINTLITQSLDAAGSEIKAIEKVTVVGNTTMQHLFAGLHPGKLGVSPYMPESCSARDCRAADLGLALNGHCPVYIFPVISGFIGGDTLGVMLSEKPYRRDEKSLIIDIGTNGEIVLGNRDALWVASCATGPALEGAHIACGMRASTGAIENVSIDPDRYLVEYDMIGGDTATQPKGLCGSAIIDAVAEMVKTGLILPSGRLCEGLPGVCEDENGIGREFVIAPGGSSPAQRKVVLTLSDVRQVQLAKAALATGIKLLMKKVGIETFDRLVLTGAFGARFNWRNAVTIGMLPEIACQADVSVVANAAGRGAVMALLDDNLRDEIQFVARSANLLELADDPDFTMEFSYQTSFPERS